MKNPRASKRQREQNLKDKARAKQERLAARRAAAETRTEKGPPIAVDETAPPIVDGAAIATPPAE